MAAPIVVNGSSFARSCTFQLDCQGAGDVMTNAQLLLAAPVAGGLRTLLTPVYANAAAVETAFRNAGGQLTARLTAGTAISTLGFGVDGGGLATLVIGAGDATTFLECKIELAHTVNA
jgi:hypothetical protein